MTFTIENIDKAFEGQAPAIQRANTTIANYIRTIAGAMSVDIKEWDIIATFGTGNGNNLTTDKRKINKILFEKANPSSDGATLTKPEPVKLTEEQRSKFHESIMPALEKISTARIDTLKSEMSSHIRNAQDHMRQIMRQLSIASRSRLEIEKLKHEADPSTMLVKQVEDILTEGCWVNPVIKGKKLYMNTKTDVIVSWRHPRGGVDVSLNLGQFAFQYDLGEFDFRVIPYKNNWSTGSRLYHPHIDSDGTICWGDAYDGAIAAIGEMKLVETLRVLYALLFSYNPANPYIDITDFENEKVLLTANRIPSYIRHPEIIRTPRRRRTAAAEPVAAESSPITVEELTPRIRTRRRRTPDSSATAPSETVWTVTASSTTARRRNTSENV